MWEFLTIACFPSRPAVALIRKLIAVLESIERLPLHLYDTPGSTYNLQVTMKMQLLLLLNTFRSSLTFLKKTKQKICFILFRKDCDCLNMVTNHCLMIV